MAKQILYLGNKLSDKNRNITTIESLSQLLKDLSFDVKTYSNQKSKTFRLLTMLWAVLKHRHFDFVLIDTYSTSAFWFAWSCAKLAQFFHLKYILILHGGNLPQRLKRNPKISKSLFLNAHINITPSAYLYQAFRDAGYENLIIIPNSIDIEQYKYKQRKTFQPKLLWVRAFADIYNPILALKVLKRLLKDYPKAKLSMVGPFKDHSIEKCKAYAEKHQLPVTFTGKLSKEDWITYAEDFDIFINTTSVDNTPVSVIEAMALGLAVVSTNVGGMPYLIKDKNEALLVNPDNEVEMQNAIESIIINNNLGVELSQNARQLAETFDWNEVKHQWQNVLK